MLTQNLAQQRAAGWKWSAHKWDQKIIVGKCEWMCQTKMCDSIVDKHTHRIQNERMHVHTESLKDDFKMINIRKRSIWSKAKQHVSLHIHTHYVLDLLTNVKKKMIKNACLTFYFENNQQNGRCTRSSQCRLWWRSFECPASTRNGNGSDEWNRLKKGTALWLRSMRIPRR